MPAGYSFSNRLLEENGSRDLRIDDALRSLVVTGIAHGTRPNRHENAVYNKLCMNFVLRGRGVYIDAAGKSYELSPGILFHRYPGVLHTTRFDPRSDYAEFFVVLDHVTGAQLMALGLISSQPIINVGIEQLVLDEYKHLIKRIKLPEYQLSSRTVLLEAVAFILGLYDRAKRNRVLGFWPKAIEDACLLLEHNLDERLELESIAEKVGASYAAFRKRFRQATGFSPHDYRIRRRLESSQHALISSSVKETARLMGYYDAFAFSAQFKRYMGCSPREFQRRARLSFVLTPLIPRRAPELW